MSSQTGLQRFLEKDAEGHGIELVYGNEMGVSRGPKGLDVTVPNRGKDECQCLNYHLKFEIRVS